MVAVSGRGWHLAPSLVACVHDADTIAPNRSRVSDGSIGDQSHAQRSSFHNPLGGWVDAIDLTYDPGHFDIHARLHVLAAKQPYWIDHLISNDQIWSATHPSWRQYKPTDRNRNQHRHHGHIAVKRNAAGRTYPGHWFTDAPGDDLPLNDRDLQLIQDRIEATVKKLVPEILKTEGIQHKLDVVIANTKKP